MPTNLGAFRGVHLLRERYLLGWTDTFLAYIDPHEPKIISCHTELANIVQASVVGSTVYVIHDGGRRLSRVQAASPLESLPILIEAGHFLAASEVFFLKKNKINKKNKSKAHKSTQSCDTDHGHALKSHAGQRFVREHPA